MIEKGIVTEISDGKATVEIQRSEACKSCEACFWAKDGKTMLLKMEIEKDVSEGDIVEIEISSRAVISSGFLVFALPMIMFLIGIFSGTRIMHAIMPSFDSNLAGIIGGFVFLLVSVVFIYALEHRASRASAFAPHIVAVEKKSEAVVNKCERNM